MLGAQADDGMKQAQPPGIVEEIGDVSRRVPIEDVTGAALRSMLIGAVIVGGLTWLARVFIARRKNTHD